jgi:ABC-type Zn uptake system ZnuABC Zn-binding protein ZnuA
MKLTKKSLSAAAAILVAAAALRPPVALAADKLKVVTTLHVLASIAKEVGGDEVEVESLARPIDDPHEVNPTPSRMVTLANADVFMELGLQLELWAENVIDGSRNAKIRRGTPGQQFLGKGISLLEIPDASLGLRSMGDVHPDGNPHVWFDPLNGHALAKNAEDALARIAPDRAETFRKNRKEFDRKLDEAFFGAELVKILGGVTLEKLHREGKLDAFLASKQYKGKPLEDLLGGWLKKMRPLKGAGLVGYHKAYPYLAQTYELQMVEHIEPKPGIPPTPGHLEEVVTTMQRTHAVAIILLPFDPRGNAEDLAQKTGAKLVDLPCDVEATQEAKDFFSFHDAIVNHLVQVVPGSK